MRINSLPLSKEVKHAIYNALRPGNLNPDEKTINDYDLCTGRNRGENTVNGGRNTVLHAPTLVIW